jgi:holliday junction resolvase Hjr
MSRKSKGINAERDLIHKFWANNWAAIRVAGSGAIKYPVPDVLAGNNIRKLAIECKASKDKTRYIEKDQIDGLKEFAKIFGAETWIAVKFNRMEWYFLTLEDIRNTGNNYVITEDIIKNKGLLFDELIK